ncbi:MAG: hypothetical protein DWI00_04140 [Planctomycetota bacterium]|nr:MAG: hypothetical protein DWI00_04140 [Planctomycetota bacterium]
MARNLDADRRSLRDDEFPNLSVNEIVNHQLGRTLFDGTFGPGVQHAGPDSAMISRPGKIDLTRGRWPGPRDSCR